jgi:DNA-binding LacI/PurR family transcriptional regulator
VYKLYRKADMMADRNDVAKKAGVSGATVSRVFNNPGSVLPETRERVLAAAKELNYHPNLIASNFVRKKSGNIGVVIPHMKNVHIFSVYYFSELLSGIGEALVENGYDLVLFFHKAGGNDPSAYKSYFEGGKIDGCILLGTLRNEPAIYELYREGYMFCLLNNYIEGLDISFADIDNVSGSFDAAGHLIKMGHRKIAFLNGPLSYMNSVDREKGFKKALIENKIPVNPDYMFEGNYGRKSGYEEASKIFKLKDKPTATVVSNDLMASGFIKGLNGRGLKVPQDMSVTGYDDSDMAVIVEPHLTTVRVPFYELGKRCASEFVKRVTGERREAFKILIKPELVIRESTKML